MNLSFNIYPFPVTFKIFALNTNGILRCSYLKKMNKLKTLKEMKKLYTFPGYPLETCATDIELDHFAIENQSNNKL